MASNVREPAFLTPAGDVVRAARVGSGLTLAQLGKLTGYSAAQVSRYERGVTPLTDVTVLRLFARSLAIPPGELGLADPPRGGSGTGRLAATIGPPSRSPSPTLARESGKGDDLRRRQLLASLGIAAATAAGALADFRDCRHARLSVTLPRLISAGHLLAAGPDSRERDAALAGIYTLTTRILIKLDDQQLGWMAADRARVLAAGTGDPLAAAEAARNLAVLARKAGWHDQARAIALTAAVSPLLDAPGPRYAAQRGLLIQSAAYTAARAGDRDTMRDLTAEAAAVAARLGDTAVLRDHGGGFTPATVALHGISAENHAGDPGAAVAAALRITPASLPTTERRARYWTDTARAYGNWGRRDQCVTALLAAEREAPEETHARPAVRDLLSSLLITGRASPELRGLAARCGIT